MFPDYYPCLRFEKERKRGEGILEILAHIRIEIDPTALRPGLVNRVADIGLLTAHFRMCRKCNNCFDPADTGGISKCKQ